MSNNELVLVLEVEVEVTCDHVLDKVGVAGTVRVSVVPGVRGVLDVSHVDGDATVPLLRSVVNRPVVSEFGKLAILASQHLGDGRGQGGLPVVHVAYGTNVAVRFVSFENLLLQDNCAEGEISLAGECQGLGGDGKFEGGRADILQFKCQQTHCVSPLLHNQ